MDYNDKIWVHFYLRPKRDAIKLVSVMWDTIKDFITLTRSTFQYILNSRVWGMQTLTISWR